MSLAVDKLHEAHVRDLHGAVLRVERVLELEVAVDVSSLVGVMLSGGGEKLLGLVVRKCLMTTLVRV